MYVVQQPNRNYSRYPVRAGLGLACTQVVLGILSIIFQVAGIILKDSHAGGVGIWCGAVYIIAGGLGIGASKTSGGRCLVISTMVMSIIAACLAAGGQISGGAINIAVYRNHHSYNYYRHHCNPSYECHPNPYQRNFTCLFEPSNHTCIADPKNEFANVTWKCDIFSSPCAQPLSIAPDPKKPAAYAILSVLIILALAEVAVAIAQSAVCCQGCCCGQDNSQRVYYAVAPQQVTVGGEGGQVPGQVAAPLVPGQVAAPLVPLEGQVMAGNQPSSGMIRLPNGQLAVILDQPGPSAPNPVGAPGANPPPYELDEKPKEPPV